jgi:hypothetical protein
MAPRTGDGSDHSILADHGAKLDGRTSRAEPDDVRGGAFLAIRPPVVKPEAIALLKKLMPPR